MQKMKSLEQQVDEILDKMNEVGYEGLSKEEKRILKKASDLFSRDKDD